MPYYEWPNGSTYIAYDSYLSNTVQDIKPDPNVLRSIRNWSSHFTHKLVRVNSDLKNVVGQSEERSKRKSSDEDCDETKLKNCGGSRTMNN